MTNIASTWRSKSRSGILPLCATREGKWSPRFRTNSPFIGSMGPILAMWWVRRKAAQHSRCERQVVESYLSNRNWSVTFCTACFDCWIHTCQRAHPWRLLKAFQQLSTQATRSYISPPTWIIFQSRCCMNIRLKFIYVIAVNIHLSPGSRTCY